MKIESCGDENFDVYMTRGHVNPNEFLAAVAEHCAVGLDGIYGRQVAHTFWIERNGKYESARKDQDGAFPVTFIGLY